MVPYIKENYFDISLDVCILLSDTATVDHLQHINHVYCLPTGCTYAFVSEWSPCTFINALAFNHTIKVMNTGTSMSFHPR